MSATEKVPEKKVLSVEDMLNTPDVEYDEVELWGGLVRIATISAGDMVTFLESNEGPAKKTAGLRILIKSLVDREGNRIGNDTHLEGFKKKSNKNVLKLVNAVTKLNGLDTKDEKELKDAIKND